MKNKKILYAILATITALTCSSNIVSAEETTEASTEAVTEVTSEITTEIPTETTAPVTTNTPEEITSVITKKIALFEFGTDPDWTGGEFKKVLPLTFISISEYGDFLGLYRGNTLNDPVDSEYYSVEYDKEKNITFTFNEKFREKYGNVRCCFTVEFENVSLRNVFGFNITDPAEQTQTESLKTESPKTGDSNATVLAVIFGLSGITACIFKKRNVSLKL